MWLLNPEFGPRTFLDSDVFDCWTSISSAAIRMIKNSVHWGHSANGVGSKDEPDTHRVLSGCD